MYSQIIKNSGKSPSFPVYEFFGWEILYAPTTYKLREVLGHVILCDTEKKGKSCRGTGVQRI